MSEDEAAKTYADLPDHVKRWLEGLQKDDTTALGQGIQLTKNAKVVGKFWKWTFIISVSTFTGMATLGDSIASLWDRIRGE